MPRQPAGTARYTLFILLLILYNQLGIDVYLPSMPAMVSALDTTTSAVQRTLTLYFVGFSLSTFVWGALSSSFGRKPLLLFGTCLFCLGSLLCAFAPSINFLLASRCIQGVGGAAPSILSRAIMRDVFEGAELLKRAAYRSMVWITIPIIAPLLGGYVQDYLGWRWNFALLALFSALVFLLVLLFLPETQKKEHKRPLGLRSIARDYAKVASNRLFWGNVLGMTLIYAMLVSYNAISPFLMQERLHLSPIAFGWALLFTSTGYFLGSFLSSWLSTRKPLKTAMNWGFAGCLFCSLAMLILSLLQLLNLWAILLPMFGLLFFSALVYPPCVAGTVAPFSRVVGTAAALVSCIVFLGSSLTTSVASHLPAQSLLSLSCIVTLLSVITPIMYHRLVFINERLS